MLEFGVSRELRFSSLRKYLLFQFVPNPFTLIKDVRKIKPGHYLYLKAADVSEVEYWRPRIESSSLPPHPEEHLRTLLEESVRCRMISDVPLGVFQSGGIDSSSIASLVQMNSEEPTRTFSVGFETDAPC
ncbi:MAG: asparagine synthase-related protein [Promethearchaeia archaeon]